MPAGGFTAGPAGGVEFEAKITPIVILSCIMAATGGLMFGYDIGVSGNTFFYSSHSFLSLCYFFFTGHFVRYHII